MKTGLLTALMFRKVCVKTAFLFKLFYFQPLLTMFGNGAMQGTSGSKTQHNGSITNYNDIKPNWFKQSGLYSNEWSALLYPLPKVEPATSDSNWQQDTWNQSIYGHEDGEEECDGLILSGWCSFSVLVISEERSFHVRILEFSPIFELLLCIFIVLCRQK